MKRALAIILTVAIAISIAACGSTPKAYPGETGITIGDAEYYLPENIFTMTGEENGLAGTCYFVTGVVTETGEQDGYPYFIVATDSGDAWISDVSEMTREEAENRGFSLDTEKFETFYPHPEVGENVRVFAEYQGMSGATGYASFIYGDEGYLAEALARSSKKPLSAAENERPQTSPSEETPTTQPSEEGSKDNPYRAGTYKVGTDCPAGEYLFFSDSSQLAYVCASSDSNQDNIIENENFSNSFFMTVADGQYLQAKRCYFVKASDYTITINDDGTLDEGMYRVGVDIPAGEYKLTADEDKGYWCLYSNSTSPFDIDEKDNFEGSTYVTVRDGQYLQVKRCTAKPA